MKHCVIIGVWAASARLDLIIITIIIMLIIHDDRSHALVGWPAPIQAHTTSAIMLLEWDLGVAATAAIWKGVLYAPLGYRSPKSRELFVRAGDGDPQTKAHCLN